MLSPARKHFQRITAAKAAGDAPTGQPQTGELYEIMAAALWEARRTLKDIKSIEAKVERKRELLPQFDAYVAGVIEAGQGAQDDVLMTVMLWRFDIGDLAGGLAVARYALQHKLDTPDRFERDTASIVAEQVADEALKQLEAATPKDDESATAPESGVAAHLVMHLSEAEALVRDADMHDQIRAKLHKALGYALRIAGQPAEALEHLKRALQLNDRVGVKKDIEKLERELKNSAPGGNAQG